MKAITIRDDEDHSLIWSDVPTPSPGPDELLIEVAATSCNRADLLQRRGKYHPPEGTSNILGLDVSGTVTEVGANVEQWKPGDRVCGLLAGGGYA